MNPLQQIPPNVRKWIYLAYSLVGLVLGGFQVAGQETVAGASVVTCLAVMAYVGTALGLTAASNLPSYQDVAEGDAPAPPVDRGAVPLQTVVLALVGIAAVVLIVSFADINVR